LSGGICARWKDRAFAWRTTTFDHSSRFLELRQSISTMGLASLDLATTRLHVHSKVEGRTTEIRVLRFPSNA
jgi:hypothetical protein